MQGKIGTHKVTMEKVSRQCRADPEVMKRVRRAFADKTVYEDARADDYYLRCPDKISEIPRTLQGIFARTGCRNHMLFASPTLPGLVLALVDVQTLRKLSANHMLSGIFQEVAEGLKKSKDVLTMSSEQCREAC